MRSGAVLGAFPVQSRFHEGPEQGFWLHFGAQNRSTIDKKFNQILSQISEGIFDGFWLDFGPIFEAFFDQNGD